MSAEQDLANAVLEMKNLITEVRLFRDGAMGINNLWPTITEGRQNTADGKYFSVPGDGAYLKLYRRAGTSQTLIAEFPDRAQVQGIVDLLSGRGITGPGDLMAVGFAGLGKDSLNDIDLTGKHPAMFARADSRTDGIFGAQVALINLPYVGTRTAQIAIGISDGGRMKYRTQLAQDEWTPVRTVYDTTNIIGSVSQSSGVPTGGIFFRSSNDIGRIAKYADGTFTQIMTVTPDWTSNALQTFSLPESFNILRDHIACNMSFNSGNTITIGNAQTVRAYGSTATNVFLSLTGSGSNGVGDAYTVTFEITGQWYE